MNEGGRFIKILLNFLKTFYSAAIKRNFFEEKVFFAALLGAGGAFYAPSDLCNLKFLNFSSERRKI